MENGNYKVTYLERRGGKAKVVRFETEYNQGIFEYNFNNRNTGARCSLGAVFEDNKSTVVINNGVFFDNVNTGDYKEVINEHVIGLRMQMHRYKRCDVYAGGYVDSGNRAVIVEMMIEKIK